MNKDSIANASIVAFSLVLLVWVIPASTPPYQGYGVAPAMMPRIAVGIMLLLSTLNLLRSLRYRALTKHSSDEKGSTRPAVQSFVHVIKFLLPCFLLMPGMYVVGFIPAGIVFMLLIQFLCGQRNHVLNIAVAVGLVLSMYVVMRYGFSIALP